MTRDEWNALLAVEPVTANQRGGYRGEDGQDHAAPAGYVARGEAIAPMLLIVFGQNRDALKCPEGADSK